MGNDKREMPSWQEQIKDAVFSAEKVYKLDQIIDEQDQCGLNEKDFQAMLREKRKLESRANQDAAFAFERDSKDREARIADAFKVSRGEMTPQEYCDKWS